MNSLPFQYNISLKPYNTFGIEVFAKIFIEIKSIDNLIQLVDSQKFIANKKLILGGGSNVLLTQDFEGIVVKNSLLGIEILKQDSDFVWIKSGAGVAWHSFVRYCVDHNYAGVENLSLIPGTVGAAPMQNIGAYGVEIKDVFESLEAITILDGSLQIFNKENCNFGYRESVFKNIFKNQFIIISVTFRLNKTPKFNTSYGAITEVLNKNGIKELSIKAISDAVIEIRSSKLPDPKVLGNSGSFFKNPEVSLQKVEELKLIYPNIPNYPINESSVKLAAGWLIEQCGWKGKIVGNTGSHKDQALVLVNYGDASGIEIWQLAQDIKLSVWNKFNVEIVAEVNVI